MKKIQFAHNWNNKLSDEQTTFSTIRRATGEKEKYYKDSVGEMFSVWLKSKPYGEAELVGVSRVPFRKLPFMLLVLDTGMTSVPEIIDLFENFGVSFKKDEVLILLFKRVQKDDVPF